MLPDGDAIEFDLCGDHLALNFANTMTERESATPIERLRSYDDLVAFAEQSGIVAAAEARRLRAWGKREPEAAEAVRRDAVALREPLYAIFAAVARGRAPAAQDLAVLNVYLQRLRLGPSFGWEWARGADAPDALLGPILRAALELLTSEKRGRVRICDADDCVWVFLDTSKNRSRRWCDMAQCGNRTKARRFYERHH